MYQVEGMRFRNREEFVKGVADMCYDYDIQINVNQDGMEQMSEGEFVNEVYKQCIGDCTDVYSYLDEECQCVYVPDEIRFLGEVAIKSIAREYYQGQKGVA